MSRFSLRTAFPRTPNPLSQAVALRHACGLPVLDLAETNPTRVGLPPPDVDLGVHPGVFDYAPEPFGLPSAREAVATHLSQRGASVDAAHVVLSASTSEAYGWLLKLLCDPGDNVLVPAPGYPLVDVLARLEGVHARSYRLPVVHGFGLDVGRVEAAIDARTRAVVVVNPGNPTGHFLHEGELHALADVCARHGLALISDEVFSNFAWDAEEGRVTSVAGRPLPCLTFALSGLSKVAGLPGLKLSWLHVGGPSHARDEALARLEDVADAVLSVSTPVQLALPALLAHAPRFQAALLKRVKGNRERLIQARPADAAWDVVPAHGGWSAVLRIPHHPGEEATCLRLLEEGVRVQPGYYYDFGGGAYLVLSLLPTPEVFTAALVPLVRVLSPPAG
ncbi:pyridoxal phosphate-dependent aminotransferase [Corallococcus carmarthensis]|uniref:Pyridoxal phosphate-dependent aminotransferase n=1 Tax=Corallococcus carmarthensis TaxID=2316728 RepID=A0A3A8JGU4_9BACT|nr:pyridoxal phosphate-dependent aminotransferase [Corallococcus carmarthensis]RKG94909.1 pyridoxal phosphate-dependent aminotransferase [Corallococcus carmarthensis]